MSFYVSLFILFTFVYTIKKQQKFLKEEEIEEIYQYNQRDGRVFFTKKTKTKYYTNDRNDDNNDESSDDNDESIEIIDEPGYVTTLPPLPNIPTLPVVPNIPSIPPQSCHCVNDTQIFPTESPTIKNDSYINYDRYCRSKECLELGYILSNTINERLDPCDNFYEFVCYGWKNDNSYRLINNNISYEMYKDEMRINLDRIVLNSLTDKELLSNWTSINKLRIFYESCLKSTIKHEDLRLNPLMKEIMNRINFTNINGEICSNWNEQCINSFQNALSWLTQRNLHNLFDVDIVDLQLPLLRIPRTCNDWKRFINNKNIFVGLYMEFFELNETIADNEYNNLLNSFIIPLVTVYEQCINNDNDQLMTNYWETFGKSYGDDIIISWTKLIYNVLNINEFDDNNKPTYFAYMPSNLNYFDSISTDLILRPSVTPLTMQLYLFTEVLFYRFDINNLLTQNRVESRSKFCLDSVKKEFPLVYGFILSQIIYDSETETKLNQTARLIKEYGIQKLINESDYLDYDSKLKMLYKENNLNIFIGFPPSILIGDHLDYLYNNVFNDDTKNYDSYIDNLAELVEFDKSYKLSLYHNYPIYTLHIWPEYTSVSRFFNLFYSTFSNYITIPISLIFKPIFNKNYPSSINYGGIGHIIGHEFSHAFDTIGLQFNAYGQPSPLITDNNTLFEFNKRKECFINQYNNVSIDIHSNDSSLVYLNGSRVFDEKIADYIGTLSSYLSWKKYINDINSDDNQLLFGLKYTPEQLFFISTAFFRCSTYKQGYYTYYNGIHSPHHSRVNTRLKNIKQFSDAFNCPINSNMNPINKCALW